MTLYHGITLGQRDRIDRNGMRSSGYPVIERAGHTPRSSVQFASGAAAGSQLVHL